MGDERKPLSNNKPLILASALAKYVISYVNLNAKTQFKGITNLKLQKILYYIEGYYMARYGYSLYPALIEAWRFGPVLPSVYYEYAIFGAESIILSPAEEEEAIEAFDRNVIDDEKKELINSVIRQKMDMDVWQLVDATHKEEPWLQATDNGKQFGGIMTKRSIMLYFRAIG